MLFEDGAGFCPWHKRDSSFKAVHELTSVAPYFIPPWGQRNVFEDEKKKGTAYTGLVVMECLHCAKAVVLLESIAILPGQEPDDVPELHQQRIMVSPAPIARELHESAPEVIRDLFAEASTCEEAGAFRAAGVMYRAAVEELVKEQQATGRTLYDKIESLKGTLSTELVEDLHEARMLGNDSIHDGLTYSAEEVEDVAKLIEEAVLVLYVQPEQKRAMREARKTRRDSAKNP
jgi:hypothetical protein